MLYTLPPLCAMDSNHKGVGRGLLYTCINFSSRKINVFNMAVNEVVLQPKVPQVLTQSLF